MPFCFISTFCGRVFPTKTPGCLGFSVKDFFSFPQFPIFFCASFLQDPFCFAQELCFLTFSPASIQFRWVFFIICCILHLLNYSFINVYAYMIIYAYIKFHVLPFLPFISFHIVTSFDSPKAYFDDLIYRAFKVLVLWRGLVSVSGWSGVVVGRWCTLRIWSWRVGGEGGCCCCCCWLALVFVIVLRILFVPRLLVYCYCGRVIFLVCAIHYCWWWMSSLLTYLLILLSDRQLFVKKSQEFFLINKDVLRRHSQDAKQKPQERAKKSQNCHKRRYCSEVKWPKKTSWKKNKIGAASAWHTIHH